MKIFITVAARARQPTVARDEKKFANMRKSGTVSGQVVLFSAANRNRGLS
jgi:hypothetical protein